MRVAVLGLGEAGSLYSAACSRRGWTVTAYDPVDVPTPEGVTRCATVAEAVGAAEVVLGLTGARAAVAVAAEAAAALAPGSCFADMNSASPALKQQLTATLAGTEALLADVAVVGSVPQHGARTPLIVSGPGSTVAARLFEELGAPVEDIGGAAGDASTRKLVRSGLMKGLAALIVETLETGKAVGLEEWTREQVAAQLAEGETGMERLYQSTFKHAARRAREMEAASRQVSDAGILPIMATATAALHQQLADHQALVDDEVVAAWKDLPVANIGDARERLGLTTGLHAPWAGASLVGRARTVQVAGGDNVGIQRIIADIRPGDVVVVDGQGDVSRALIGELIAGRLIARGAVGMVMDGAVRDVEDLEELGFPVWSRGRSAAGPYKNGPFRHGAPVAVGGVVCQEGDLVVADGDGVTFVRPSEAPALLVAARAVQEEEARRRRDIQAQIDARLEGVAS